MKFDNPTSLQIGMSGTIAGLRYRVVGRVVMGMEEAGEIYYWNEFNLVNDRGEFATLVFEETENGAEWRMFTLFEPQHPMSAQEAATKRVGDTVNFDGTPLRVTLVDESRVNFIEGQAPEGEEIGDVARYFNAEGGNKMQVASWTGDEIEIYRGLNLPRGAVRDAFGLGADLSPNFQLASRDLDSPSASWASKLFAVLIAGSILFAGTTVWKSSRVKKDPVKPKLVASKIAVGKSGKLLGKDFHIERHAVVEIAQVNRIYDRHEYVLGDGEENSLLICGLKPETKNWVLFTAFKPDSPITPERAAALRVGDNIDFAGLSLRVTELSRAKIQLSEGVGTNGTVFYGFSAEGPDYLLLTRWNANGITFYRGKACTENSVLTAFK